MNEKLAILRRMVDICFAVKIASSYGQWLGKVQLQKFIYLLDVLRPLYEIMPPLDGHLTYKYGPYDVKIQSAADVLAFRGFLKYHQVTINPQNHVAITYLLTSDGEKLVSRFTAERAFSSSWEICTRIGFWLNKLGWKRIVDLVYSEPTFVSIRQKGFGQRIIPYDATKNSAALIMAILDFGLLTGYKRSSINNELMVELFFQYLDSAEKKYKQTLAANLEE